MPSAVWLATEYFPGLGKVGACSGSELTTFSIMATSESQLVLKELVTEAQLVTEVQLAVDQPGFNEQQYSVLVVIGATGGADLVSEIERGELN